MPSEARQGQSISVLTAVGALVLGLALAGGCASDGGRGTTASGAEETYPNLGDVPDRPVTMSEEQRRQLEKGLVADSQGRAYSEDEIAFQAEPAEPLPPPIETSAGDASASEFSDVTMPGAVAPPFSGNQDSPPSPSRAPAAAASPVPSTPEATATPEVTAPEVTATPPGSPVLSVPEAPATPVLPPPPAEPPTPEVQSMSPATETPAMPSVPSTTSSASPAGAASSAGAAAAVAQASPTNIPVPPEDPLARATTPPFSGASPAAPAPPVAEPPAAYAPSPAPSTPAPSTSAPTAPATTPGVAPSPSATAAYTPVADPPAGLAGDVDSSDLNRAQLDALQPTTPPFSGATGVAGAVSASNAPTSLSGPTPDVVTPPAPAYAPAAVAPATTATTTAYAAPAATAPSAPPPASSAYPPPPPVGVQEVFEARLDDPLPDAPLPPLPANEDPERDAPLTTVVVSSSGVATFEELPVNIPVVEREPTPAAVPGAARRGTLARKAVPQSSVKVATILFEDGSASLREREKEIVREVYERYLSSGRNVRVVGHSSSRTRNMDPVRHRMVNFGISAERANAVALELQRLGVPSEQITVVAAADDMPMYYEVMPSGEAGNRRTEIYLD